MSAIFDHNFCWDQWKFRLLQIETWQKYTLAAVADAKNNEVFPWMLLLKHVKAY